MVHAAITLKLHDQKERPQCLKILGALAAYKDEFMKMASANSRNYVCGTLETLQNFLAGNAILAPAFVNTREQPMHPQDERMIRQFMENVKDYRITPDGIRGRGTGKVPAATIKSNVQALNTFARWLRE
ncbi:hypothetical protein ABIE89_000679 [Bradyrhizobium niftali]